MLICYVFSLYPLSPLLLLPTFSLIVFLSSSSFSVLCSLPILFQFFYCFSFPFLVVLFLCIMHIHIFLSFCFCFLMVFALIVCLSVSLYFWLLMRNTLIQRDWDIYSPQVRLKLLDMHLNSLGSNSVEYRIGANMHWWWHCVVGPGLRVWAFLGALIEENVSVY